MSGKSTDRLDRRSILMLAALMLAECSSGFEWTMIYAALPKLNAQFNDPVGVGWVITIFFLISAAVTAIGARLGDLYGRRRVLLVAMALSALGSGISAFSAELAWVVTGRGVQAASAAILPLSIGLAREWLPKSRVPFAVGMILAAANLSAAAGLLLGGAIIDLWSWHAIFQTSIALAVAGGLAVWFTVPKSASRTEGRKIDVLGGVLFVPGLFAVLWAITKAPAWGWGSAWTLGTLAAGAAIIAAWVLYELRHREPLLDVRLFANRQVGLAYLCYVLAGLGGLQVFQILSLLMQQPTWTGVGFGLSATVMGMFLLPAQLMGMVGAPVSGWLAGSYNARTATLVGAAFLAAGWVSLALLHGSLPQVAVGMITASFGMAILYAAVPNLVIEVVPEQRTSEATGMAAVVRATFSGLGAQIVAFILAASALSSPEHGTGVYPSASAFGMTFAYVAATAVLMLAFALLLPRRSIAKAQRELAHGH